jgi:hypothetical protein
MHAIKGPAKTARQGNNEGEQPLKKNISCEQVKGMCQEV